MPRTLAQKIWHDHHVTTRNDGRQLIYMDRHVIHELHGPHAFERVAMTQRSVRRPDITFGVLDHAVSTLAGRTEESSRRGAHLAKGMRAAQERWGVKLFGLDDPRQGISHVVAPELALVLPGSTYACPDSHACTVGGIGALAFACGTSDLEHVLVTQTLAMGEPKQMLVRLDGKLPPGVTAKDVILRVIGVIGTAGARGHIVEYSGTVVDDLSIEARMTLCNMSIEAGARSGIIAPDAKTISWLEGRPHAPNRDVWPHAVAHWKTLESDRDAVFDKTVSIDCSNLAPQITWGIDQSQVLGIDDRIPDLESLSAEKRPLAERALAYMGLAPGDALDGLPVSHVFIGSCTNARIEDLEAAADVVRGRKVAYGVHAFVVPGSSSVKREAEARGLDVVFTDAGLEWHESGCSLCGGSNGDTPAPGERIVSTTNRNFENRQGVGVRTHLASPGMAAAAAICGRISDVRKLMEPSR